MATPSKAVAPTHRLLYRGSLSLSDSYLPLDGLSFSARVSDIHSSPALLNNPLALTLESMRGLPLHLLGIVKVKDTWIDPPGDILVDIHPDATLTRIYFENTFCLAPITSPTRRTEYGVRVSLTENNDPDTPDLLIYGELRDAPLASSADPTPSTSSSPPQMLHLLAARIHPGPPPTPSSFRLPRPDDPTPRRPPAAFGAKRKRDVVGLPFPLTADSKRAKTGEKGKGKASAKDGDDAMRKAAAEVMLRMPKPGKNAAVPVDLKALGKGARVGVKKDVFKIPNVPVRSGSGQDADIFGPVSGEPPDVVMGDAGVDTERENKTAVKKAVSRALAGHGILKTHAEFTDVFQTCYRGASFALRRRMKAALIDAATIDHFVDAHVKLYVVDAPS